MIDPLGNESFDGLLSFSNGEKSFFCPGVKVESVQRSNKFPSILLRKWVGNIVVRNSLDVIPFHHSERAALRLPESTFLLHPSPPPPVSISTRYTFRGKQAS